MEAFARKTNNSEPPFLSIRHSSTNEEEKMELIEEKERKRKRKGIPHKAPKWITDHFLICTKWRTIGTTLYGYLSSFMLFLLKHGTNWKILALMTVKLLDWWLASDVYLLCYKARKKLFAGLVLSYTGLCAKVEVRFFFIISVLICGPLL